MTPEELTAIEQRANAATPGPWDYSPLGTIVFAGENTGVASLRMTGDNIANAAFVAGSRSDIPALLAEVRRLQKQIAGLIDQEVGQAMDCAKHERQARADERAKLAAESRCSSEAVDALLYHWEVQDSDLWARGWEEEFEHKLEAVRAGREPKP